MKKSILVFLGLLLLLTSCRFSLAVNLYCHTGNFADEDDYIVISTYEEFLENKENCKLNDYKKDYFNDSSLIVFYHTTSSVKDKFVIEDASIWMNTLKLTIRCNADTSESTTTAKWIMVAEVDANNITGLAVTYK